MQVEKARFAENIQHRFAEAMREHSSCCTPPSTDVPTSMPKVETNGCNIIIWIRSYSEEGIRRSRLRQESLIPSQ